MPIFGPPNIQKLKEEKNVKGLYKALRNNDKNIVRDAGLALVEFGVYNPASLIYGVMDPDYEIRRMTYLTFSAMVYYGFIPLVNSLHDPHESVRSASISAFLLRRDPRATQVLGECLLSDPSSLVREIVVPVLVQLGGYRSYEYLSKAKNDPNSRVRNRIEDELNKANIITNVIGSKTFDARFSDERFSIYSIWEDLSRVLTSDFEKYNTRYPTYSSPLGKSCKSWMEKAGNALRVGDDKTAYHYLWNIDNATQESLDSFRKYQKDDTPDEWKKPFIEFNQASKLLITKLL